MHLKVSTTFDTVRSTNSSKKIGCTSFPITKKNRNTAVKKVMKLHIRKTNYKTLSV